MPFSTHNVIIQIFAGHMAMRNFLVSLWADEQGAEVAEWVIVVALIVAVGLVVYFQILAVELQGGVTAIGQAILAQILN